MNLCDVLFESSEAFVISLGEDRKITKQGKESFLKMFKLPKKIDVG
jgi:hypothetical protein